MMTTQKILKYERYALVGIAVVMAILVLIELGCYGVFKRVDDTGDLAVLRQFNVKAVMYLTGCGIIVLLAGCTLSLMHVNTRRLEAWIGTMFLVGIVGLLVLNAGIKLQNRVQDRIDDEYQAGLVTKRVTSHHYTQIDETTFKVNGQMYHVQDSRNVVTSYAAIPQKKRTIKITWQQPKADMNKDVKKLAGDYVRVANGASHNNTLKVNISK